MYQISKRFRFEAAHSLPHLPSTHKCRQLHGHSYQVELVLECERLDARGFVIDYAELDNFKYWIDRNLDHKDLNQLEIFQDMPTTAEHLAFRLGEVAATLGLRVGDKPGVRLVKVVVKETEATTATWINPKE